MSKRSPSPGSQGGAGQRRQNHEEGEMWDVTMEGMNSLGGVSLTDGKMGRGKVGGGGGLEDEKEEQERVLTPAPKKGHS